MTNPFHIQYHPVFERGVFEKHPALFDRFLQRTPEHLKKEYQKARETIHKCEGTITWPLIIGPGFCGATHPGADNIFLSNMIGPDSYIYNSDCLYVNPAQKVFALSDAPGITTFSRRLFSELDNHLKSSSVYELETIINKLNNKTGVNDGATISLIGFPGNKSDNRPAEALAFIAGDSYLFHGNIFQRSLIPIAGHAEFIGTPDIHLEPKRIELAEGDFFIIATDGILSLRVNSDKTSLEEILLEHVKDDIDNFAFSVINSCNRSSEEKIYDRVITRFGGSDNVSALLVYPQELTDITCPESSILGGYITTKAQY